MSLRRLTLALLAGSALAVPSIAEGQRWIARADSLFRQGRVFAAETLYYYAARRSPRDPAARLALGRYLAARGALKVGAVLMEEAAYFGGDRKVVATYLAPVYARLGNYKALASLPASPLPYAQRARAEWLAANAPATSGPDSTAVQLGAADSSSIGSIRIVIGDETLEAKVDPRAQGLVLDTAWLSASGVKRFASTYDADWRNAAGVVHTLGIGELTLANVPAAFTASGTRRTARIGLDVLAELAPTIDRTAGTLTLRRSGRISDARPGERIPTLTYPGGIWLIQRDGLWPLGGTNARVVLGTGPWTINPWRGEIILGP
ncbi:MAG TPA: hypothetical protein VHM67_04225 [Gemmatimonadaceae bacterium]|nr:hypothetical protein [Gemmatimonadaceae bacterium]